MGQRKTTFSVPAASGDYATDVIVCRPDNAAGVPDSVVELDLNVVSLPSGASIEVEQLKIGGNASDDDDWMAAESITSDGAQDLIAFSGWPGVRIRAKSGGTDGDAEVHAAWLTKGDC